MSIANSGVLANISLSVWTGRKLDREVSEEVDVAKSTKTRAGNYHKNLFAGVTELEQVKTVGGKIRNWHVKQTLPWADSGERLLPMANFMDYKRELSVLETEFNTAVQNFCTKYGVLIAAQAFQLGALFNRDEYPHPDVIASKFNLSYTFSPVPDVGDWRVTADDAIKQELARQYEQAYADRLNSVTKDLWDRLHGCLTHMQGRLSVSEDGKKTIFRDSMLENAAELCGLLTRLNVTNDPKLEHARKELEKTIMGLDAKDLRETDGARAEVKSRIDDILKFMD